MSESTISVVRVETKSGSHIEPPLDQSWTDLEKLRWNAACWSLDSGIEITVRPTQKVFPRTYMVTAVGPRGSTGFGDVPFREAWDAIGYVGSGARLATTT